MKLIADGMRRVNVVHPWRASTPRVAHCRAPAPVQPPRSLHGCRGARPSPKGRLLMQRDLATCLRAAYRQTACAACRSLTFYGTTPVGTPPVS